MKKGEFKALRKEVNISYLKSALVQISVAGIIFLYARFGNIAYLHQEAVSHTRTLQSYIMIMQLMSCVLAGIALIEFINILSGTYQKGIKRFLKAHPLYDIKRLEGHFNISTKIGNRVYVNPELTFLIHGTRVVIIKHDEYQCAKEDGSSLVPKLMYIDKKGKKKKYIVSKPDSKALLAFYEEYVPELR